MHEGDKCILDPSKCTKGLSVAFFYKLCRFDEDYEYDPYGNPILPSDRQYLISTGGEPGKVGFAVYIQEEILGCVVSSGDNTWTLEVSL